MLESRLIYNAQLLASKSGTLPYLAWMNNSEFDGTKILIHSLHCIVPDDMRLLDLFNSQVAISVIVPRISVDLILVISHYAVRKDSILRDQSLWLHILLRQLDCCS